jgi:hypothetical protein
MDGLTHYIIPYLIGYRLKFSRAQMMAATFGGLFPDSDVVLIVFGFDAVRSWHATVTHSLPGLVTIALVGALLFWRFYGAVHKWYEVAIPGLMGASSHTVLDMFNASRAGWKALFPFIPEYPEAPEPDLPTAAQPLGYYVPYWEDVLWLQPAHAAILYLAVALFSLIVLFWFIRKGEYPWAIWTGRRGARLYAWLKAKVSGKVEQPMKRASSGSAAQGEGSGAEPAESPEKPS